MALTRDVSRDAGFHKALVAEAIECLRNGDFDTAMAIFQDHISAPASLNEGGNRLG